MVIDGKGSKKEEASKQVSIARLIPERYSMVSSFPLATWRCKP